MNTLSKFILTVIIITVTVVSTEYVLAQDPISKPMRPTSTQQSKPTTNKSKQQTQSRRQVVSGTINGHDYVDLGLSVKWATCNIGASKPSGYGNYYAWGETTTKSSYTFDNSEWAGISYSDLRSHNVIDSNGNLLPQYDAARQNWGALWRMPTLQEIKELVNKCSWKWISEEGNYGHKVTGPNGNSIFLPAAGCRNYDGLFDAATEGRYWCATACRDEEFSYDYSYELYFRSSKHFSFEYNRLNGLSIRPVTK